MDSTDLAMSLSISCWIFYFLSLFTLRFSLNSRHGDIFATFNWFWGDYGWQSYIYVSPWLLILTIGIPIIASSLHSAVFAVIWHYIDLYVSISVSRGWHILHRVQLVSGSF